MNVECDITIDFNDVDKLKTVLKSIEVDDFSFVKSKVVGKRLVAKIESKSIPSLLHTLDDYLACVSVAVKVVDKD